MSRKVFALLLGAVAVALGPAPIATAFPESEADGIVSSRASAEEAYANRAYPGTEIPMALTFGAQAAFAKLKDQGEGGHDGSGQWTLIGPSTAKFPAVLTFSGADYVTSGRITALALAGDCKEEEGNCRLWVGAAGGGIWRTDRAFAEDETKWTFVSGSFATNAIGALTYDAAHGALYAGTGEPNASADSEAGLGIYKSTDGGDTWTKLAGVATGVSGFSGGFADGRSIATILIDPTDANVVVVATTRGVRGVGSTGGATSSPPVAAPVGLWKSTDAGATFSMIWNGNGTVRGVNEVRFDPGNHATLFAAAFQQGIWRSTSGGPFTQIFTPVAPAFNTDRAEFAVTTANGKTRMYVGDGAQGHSTSPPAPGAKFFRTDDANAAAPVFADLTTAQNTNYCTGQCWYDNVVYSPAGYPDVVYLGGSYQYGEYGGVSNSRGVLLSTDAGASFTDMSWDATSDTTPNGLHPDHHALVTLPGDPYTFFEGSDGGLMRSSGKFKNVSYQCATRGLSATALPLCQQLLSRVPTRLTSLNAGLSTLQFQSLSANPFDSDNLMGGTQDNGTFEKKGSTSVWPQIIYGDGGQSGFSSGNGALRVNTFTGQANDVNFHNGDPTKWVVAAGPIAASPESSAFYPPVIADPHSANAGTIFQGSQSVWRTQDWAGNQAYLEANCPEFTTAFFDPACGDFVPIGPSGNTDLTALGYGSRAGGVMAFLARTTHDQGTLWAATTKGRVFLSTNSGLAAASVTFTRLDSLAGNSPGRFVSGIAVDPANGNHAWLSYSGYNFNTPTQPGHVFEVTYEGGAATWLDVSFNLGDLPATGIAFDDVTGDLYAASDFGVMRLRHGTTSWTVAGTGLPNVEVPGLTIVPASRKLYAATHGRSGWLLILPGHGGEGGGGGKGEGGH